jgi:hypothetical protein
MGTVRSPKRRVELVLRGTRSMKTSLRRCIFVGYLMTRVISWNVRGVVVQWQMSNELVRTWKGAAVAI